MVGIDSKISFVVFVIIFSVVVWHSTRAVDKISVVLILFMIIRFAFGMSGLATNVDLYISFDTANTNSVGLGLFDYLADLFLH